MATLPPEDHHQQRRAAAAEAPRQGGRRKNKGSAAAAADEPGRKKKTPQRGMGVAQLERLLSLQADQRWKKMNNPFNANVTVPPVLHHHPSSVVFAPAAVPGSFLPPPAVAAMNNNTLPLQFHKLGSFGYGEFLSSSPSSSPNLYGFGRSNNSTSLFNVNENSKELSSTPNFTFNSCNFCHKKKRVNDGNVGYNHWVNITGENQDYLTGFSTKQFHHMCYADKNVAEAHQKNGSYSASPSSLSTGVIEYEFFPAERSRNSSTSCSQQQDDAVMMTPTTSESSPPVVAAMASSGEASFHASPSTTIDLSLRLSY